MKRLHEFYRPISTASVAGLVIWSTWLVYESTSLSRCGKRTIGECIGIDGVSSGRGSGWVFRFAYRDESGELRRAVGKQGPGWPYLFQGDKIPILYRPADPSICYPDSFVAIRGVTVFVAGVAALGVLYLVIDYFRPDHPTV